MAVLDDLGGSNPTSRTQITENPGSRPGAQDLGGSRPAIRTQITEKTGRPAAATQVAHTAPERLEATGHGTTTSRRPERDVPHQRDLGGSSPAS